MVASGDDDSCHPIPHKNTNRHTNLKQCEPHRLLCLPELVNPDGVVDQQKYLTNTCNEASTIGRVLVFEIDETQQRQLQDDQ